MGVLISRQIDIPILSIPASDMKIGNSVFMNVNGVSTEFLVVHQGKPSSLYDDSCDGTWLLMKDLYRRQYRWNSTQAIEYENSTIHTYLNNDFLALLDANVQDTIIQAKIPYVKSEGVISSGSNGLSTKIFLLGCYELGWTTSNLSEFPVDGACLDYFSGFSAADSRRVGYYNGTATTYWTRSVVYGNTDLVFTVSASSSIFGRWGQASASWYSTSNYVGVRPALILPSTAKFDPETNEFKGVS